MSKRKHTPRHEWRSPRIKTITAAPPEDAERFFAAVPDSMAKNADTHVEKSEGCYITPRRKEDE